MAGKRPTVPQQEFSNALMKSHQLGECFLILFLNLHIKSTLGYKVLWALTNAELCEPHAQSKCRTVLPPSTTPPPKVPGAACFWSDPLPNPCPHATTDLFSIPIAPPFPECHRDGVRHHVSSSHLCIWIFSLSVTCLSSIQAVARIYGCLVFTVELVF